MLSFALACALLQNAQAYQQAVALFQRNAGSDDPAERAFAARELGRATYAAKDRETVRYLGQLLANELARGARDEAASSGQVIVAVEEAIARVRAEEAVQDLVDLAGGRRQPERVRVHVIRGMSGIDAPAVAAALLDLLGDRSEKIQIAALYGIGLRKPAGATAAVLRIAREGERWESRYAAIRALGEIKDTESVAPLIEILRGEYQKMTDARFRERFDGRLMDEVVRALRLITSLDYEGYIPQIWESQWARRQRGEQGDGAEPSGETESVPTEFYGIPTRSTRIVFVLDISGSMAWNASDRSRRTVETGGGEHLPGPAVEDLTPAERTALGRCRELYNKWKEYAVTTRIESLKKEFIRSIFFLDPRVHFAVIYFSDNPMPMPDQLVPATWANKALAMADCDRRNPVAGTNYWDSLETAFQYVAQRGDQISRQEVNPAERLNGADTFFFLSDGEPTVGSITDKNEILGQLRKINAVRNVVIHTIALGDPQGGGRPMGLGQDVDPEFLEQIAGQNGGEFRHVTGR